MKRFLIVFPDVHLAYSPTILNIFKELKNHFAVSLIAPEPSINYSSQKILDADIQYFANKDELSIFFDAVKIKHKILRIFNKKLNVRSLMTPLAKTIISYLKNFSGEVIVVDFLSLWCAQQAGKRAHLISLEILQQDLYKDACNLLMIKSVIIQSEERYNFLFNDVKPKSFIIQNSPNYVEFEPDYSKRQRTELIYCGSAMPCFGIISCIDFIKDYPEFNLTIKGPIPSTTLESINTFYKDLLIEGRLILDSTYLDPTSLTYFVSKFRIGFGFYDFYRFEKVRSFNYFTAPSGKIFQYLNSGVPIIANKLPGFDLIEKKNAGILIPHLSSVTIKAAINEIELKYEQMSRNAKQISKDLDFSKNVLPFINHLKNSN